jgi:hypothetical protein
MIHNGMDPKDFNIGRFGKNLEVFRALVNIRFRNSTELLNGQNNYKTQSYFLCDLKMIGTLVH